MNSASGPAYRAFLPAQQLVPVGEQPCRSPSPAQELDHSFHSPVGELSLRSLEYRSMRAISAAHVSPSIDLKSEMGPALSATLQALVWQENTRPAAMNVSLGWRETADALKRIADVYRRLATTYETLHSNGSMREVVPIFYDPSRMPSGFFFTPYPTNDELPKLIRPGWRQPRLFIGQLPSFITPQRCAWMLNKAYGTSLITACTIAPSNSLVKCAFVYPNDLTALATFAKCCHHLIYPTSTGVWMPDYTDIPPEDYTEFQTNQAKALKKAFDGLSLEEERHIKGQGLSLSPVVVEASSPNGAPVLNTRYYQRPLDH